MKKIALRPEHASELDFYEKALRRYQDELQEIVKEGTFLTELLTKLNSTQVSIHKMQLPFQDANFLRASQSVAFILEQCHHNRKQEMICRGNLASIQEALTVFLAQKYAIDPTHQWNLDTVAGCITQGEP